MRSTSSPRRVRRCAEANGIATNHGRVDIACMVTRPTSANVGAAGEALVAARLLSIGIDVARPYSDNGVDLVAFSGRDYARAVPIQVKTASAARIHFERGWFTLPGLILAYVWLGPPPRFFVFDGVNDVERFLAQSTKTRSWLQEGKWSITSLGPSQKVRLGTFEDAWHKVLNRLGCGSAQHEAM
jgi:hypothetical protein